MSSRRNATGPIRPVRGPRRVPTVLRVNTSSRALVSSSLLEPGADCGAPMALTKLLHPAVTFRQPGLTGKTRQKSVTMPSDGHNLV